MTFLPSKPGLPWIQRVGITSILLACLLSGLSQQPAQVDDTLKVSKKKSNGRTWFVAGTHVAFLAASYIALEKAWYADFPKQSFHFFNDIKEWNQMDKAGHMWTSYQISRGSTASWKWAGLNQKQSVFWEALAL